MNMTNEEIEFLVELVKEEISASLSAMEDDPFEPSEDQLEELEMARTVLAKLWL